MQNWQCGRCAASSSTETRHRSSLLLVYVYSLRSVALTDTVTALGYHAVYLFVDLRLPFPIAQVPRRTRKPPHITPHVPRGARTRPECPRCRRVCQWPQCVLLALTIPLGFTNSYSDPEVGFRGLWKRVKPLDKPEEGVPLDTDDPLWTPLLLAAAPISGYDD
jgi:hypothetical protein